jgi:hypothetical protein
MTELKLLLRLLDLFMLNVTLKKSNGINRILGLALNTEKFMLLGSNTESARQGSRFRRSKPRNINFSVFNANLVFSISSNKYNIEQSSLLHNGAVLTNLKTVFGAVLTKMGPF